MLRSIERQLLAWIIGTMSLGTLVVAMATYQVILDELNEIYDADLRNVAESLGSYRPFEPSPQRELKPRHPAHGDLPAEAQIVTVTWTPDGRLAYTSDPRVAIPFLNTEALTRTRVGAEEWIIYTDVSASGVAQAAQRAAVRRETAAESASKVFPPLSALAVVVSVLMLFALRRGMRPVDQVAQVVAGRSPGSLAPVEIAGVPSEISPLVQAINGLLGRLAATLSAQRHFLADAAHELRTPVTALHLQLHLLKRAADDAARSEALVELESGIARTRRLVEQLLEVARAEPDEPSAPPAPYEAVDLGELVRSVVGSFSVKAVALGIDLGAAGPTGILTPGDAHRLTVLLNNLVENALRYTPEGGVVDVEAALVDGAPALRVVDNGPGIPQAEHERVFRRFHRGEEAQAQARDASGSGLGLAIVRAIAERHGARVSLHTPPSGRGLEVRVMFPPRPA